ncbi:MAG TPA: hypothetical protein PKD26_15850 [Pyrinomonadaceae bacterium]|nr:hypothetical protein [Pyrinomonadaceae bacterium]
MRKTLLIVGAIFLGFSTIAAQVSQPELSELQKVAGIPSDEILRTVGSSPIPGSKPLKIYLAIKMPGNAKKDLAKLAEKWNRGEAAKFGPIEVVNDVNNADVILAEFRYSGAKPVETHSVRASVGQPASTTFGSGRNSSVDTKRDYDVFHQPVISYLVSRENGVWTVLYAQIEAYEPERQLSDPTLRLWGEFLERLRSR